MNAKTQNAVIAILLAVSVVLCGLFVSPLMTTQPVQAGVPAGMNQYLICPVKIRNDKDVIFVIDVLKSRMNTYVLDNKNNAIVPADLPAAQQYLDLNQMFVPGK